MRNEYKRGETRYVSITIVGQLGMILQKIMIESLKLRSAHKVTMQVSMYI